MGLGREVVKRMFKKDVFKDKKHAKQYLEAWSKGADISRGIIEDALEFFLKPSDRPFVEECFRLRKEFENRGKD